jgi:photosystem II stability/assembly factor-like uncharacterized protein
MVSETLTAPVVTSVNPGVAPNDVDTDIVINGSGFTATLSVTVVLTAPTVFIGDEPLPNVIWANTTTMSATVPWGLMPDVYSMTVINPDGISGTLPSAFTVTQGIGVFNTGGPYGGTAVQLVLNPHISSTVYASMFGAGLFVSEDAAGTWEPIHNHDWPIQLDVDAHNPNLLYFGADSGDMYRSQDNGETWERISDSFYAEYGCFRTYPVAHPSETDHVYFAMGSCAGIPLAPGEGGVFSSTNAGDTWITHTHGLSDTDVHSLAIDPEDPKNLLAGTFEGNLFTSNNSGADWTFSTQLTGTVTRLYFNPHPSESEAWAITSSQAEGRGYLYRSTNLTDWTLMDVYIHAGGGSSQAQMAFRPDSVWLAAGSVYSSTDSGAHWNALTGPGESTVAIAISSDDPQTIYAGTDFGVEVSYDGGINWQEMNEGLAAMVPSAITVSADDPDTVYVKTAQGLFASQNGGNSWQDLDYGSGGFPGGNLLAVDPFSSTRLYFTAGCEGQFCIDISPDAGSSWHLITSTLPSTTTYEGWSCNSFAIAPSPHTPGRILVGASLAPPGYGFDFTGVFYRSDDYGATWQSIEPTQPVSRITEIAYDAFDPDLVYAAGSASGLWRSRDGGNTWANVPVGTMEPPIGIGSIAVHPDVTGTIYVRAGSLVTPNWPSELWVYEDAGETWRLLNDAEVSVDLLVAPPLPEQPFYSLYTGCGDGLCRSLDEGKTWSTIEGISRPEILVGASDGNRSLIYLGIPGGLPTSVGGQTTRALDAIPGRGSLLGGGVYRLTTLLSTDWVYLPLVLNSYAP